MPKKLEQCIKKVKQQQKGKRNKYNPYAVCKSSINNRMYRLKHKLISDTYDRYKKITNMSYTELRNWSKNRCSKQASLTRNPIKRNLQLLALPKTKWTMKHVRWANKTVSFIKRMIKVNRGDIISKVCPYSKRDISLMNWAYNPNK